MDKISLMHRLNPKYIRIAGIVIVSLIIILLIGGYIAYTKREAILQHEIAKAKATAKSKYNLDLEIGSAHFTGLSTVSFTDISIIPAQRDSLLSIKKFDVSVKIMPLLYGKVKLADVVLSKRAFEFNRRQNHNKNFDFIFKRKKDTTEKSKVDLSELSYNLINQLLYKIPDDLTLSNFLISFTTDSSSFKLLTKTASIKKGQLTSTINVNDGAATWHVAGRMHPSDKNIAIKWYADGKKVELPFIEKKFRLKVNFDTLSTRLSKVENSDGETRIYGYWGVNNLLINQPGLSSSDIEVPSAGIDANVFVVTNYVFPLIALPRRLSISKK